MAAAKDFDIGSPRSGNGEGGTIDTLKYAALVLGKEGADETVLAGDSIMAQYIPRVRRLAGEAAIDMRQNRIVVAFYPGCPPIPDIAREADPSCAEAMDKILPALSGSAIKTVAFAAFWTNHFKYANFYLRGDPSKTLLYSSEVARERAFTKLASLISRLVASGKRVFVILETPSSPAFDPERMLPTGWARLSGRPRIPDSPMRADIENYKGEISRRLREIAEAAGARVIDPTNYVCDKDVCPAFTKNGRPMYFNFDHLRASFVSESATWVDEIFRPAPR